MNKYKEAIKEIRKQFNDIDIDYSSDKDVTAIAILHGETAEKVIEAIQKQIPKKPKCKTGGRYMGDDVDDNDYLSCPKCKSQLGVNLIYFNYCPNCGQSIDKE
jgi:Zn finger protein HypA/HybF involved in hydrogenase expression